MSTYRWSIVLLMIGWTHTVAAQPLTPVPEPAPSQKPLTPVPEPPPGATPYPVSSAPSPLGMERRGFVIGLAFGGGVAISSFNGANSYWGFGFEFMLGGMLTPNLAVVFDTSSLTRWIGYDQRLSVDTTMFALQYWAAPKIWVKVGGGFGFLAHANTWDAYVINSGVGGAIGAAIGYEVAQRRNFAVDVQFRYTGDFFEDLTVTGLSLLIGVNWY